MKEEGNVHYNNMGELPTIHIQLRKSSNDFIVEELNLSTSGRTGQEAIALMEYAIKKRMDL